MASFTLTPVEKGIMRCQHSNPFSHEDVRSLAAFLHDYRGKLLIDLNGNFCERMSGEFKAISSNDAHISDFWYKLDPKALEISESYYTHEVQYFATEAEALDWLRNQ